MGGRSWTWAMVLLVCLALVASSLVLFLPSVRAARPDDSYQKTRGGRPPPDESPDSETLGEHADHGASGNEFSRQQCAVDRLWKLLVSEDPTVDFLSFDRPRHDSQTVPPHPPFKGSLQVTLQDFHGQSLQDLTCHLHAVVLFLCILYPLLVRGFAHLNIAARITRTTKGLNNVPSLKNDLKVLLHAFLFSHPLLDLSSTNLNSKYSKSKLSKNSSWMVDPLRKMGQWTQHAVYMVLERVASFRPIFSSDLLHYPSVLSLSDAGFIYSGRGCVAECQECHSQVNIQLLASPPTDSNYHNEGCSFVKSTDTSFTSEEQQAMLPTLEYQQAIPSTHRDQISMSSTFEDQQAIPSTPEDQQGIPSTPDNQQAMSSTHKNQQAMSSTHKDQQAMPSTSKERQGIPSPPSDRLTISQTTSTDPGGRCPPEASSSTESVQTVKGHSSLTQVELASEVSSIETLEPSEESSFRPQEPNEESSFRLQETLQATATIEASPNISVLIPQPPASASNEELGATAAPVEASSVSGSMEDVESNFNFDLSDEFEGEHQICEGDRCDSAGLRDRCSKNAGHFSQYPTRLLQEIHLPSAVRHPDFLKFLTLIKQSVVRIVIKRKGKKNCVDRVVYGTGIAHVKEPSEEPAGREGTSKWTTLAKYLPGLKPAGFVFVDTCDHLFSEQNLDFHHTEVEFFQENPKGTNVMTVKVVALEKSQTPGVCKVTLKCAVNSRTLLDQVRRTESDCLEIARGLPHGLKQRLAQRCFLISHPHGGEQMLSHGEHVLVKYVPKQKVTNGQTVLGLERLNNHTQLPRQTKFARKGLFYTADTCQGSSGGLVIAFTKSTVNGLEDTVPQFWMHCGVSRKHGLNSSVLKELTPEDRTNHGQPVPPRPSTHDLDDANSDSNKVVRCPVLTVTAAPAHPAYTTYRTRLDSYPDPFLHVHTRDRLAQAGFFYAGYGDCVRCFHCGLGLRSWRPGDDIHAEHQKNRPDCQFLQLEMRAHGFQLGFQSHVQGNPSTASETTRKLTGQQALSSDYKHLTLEGTAHERVVMDLPGRCGPRVPQVVTVATAVLETKGGSSQAAVASSPVTKNSVEQVLEREQFYLKQLLTCKVCCRNPVKDLFLPCGELVACLDCSKLLTHCPSCHGKILATVTTYFS